MKIPIGIEKDTEKVCLASELERKTQRGLDCNCICPECKTDLVAKLGEKHVKHFAHTSGNGTRKCTETALHRFGKYVLSNLNSISLCPYEVESNGVKDILGREHYLEDKALFGKTKVFIKSSEEEKSIGDIRSDVFSVASYNKNDLEINFEIKVWHEVDEDKCEKIKKLDLNTIEIDISHLLNEDVTEFETVKKELNNSLNQKIVYLSNKFVETVQKNSTLRLQKKVNRISKKITNWILMVERELKQSGYIFPNYPFEFRNLPEKRLGKQIKAKFPGKPKVNAHLEIIAFTHIKNMLFELTAKNSSLTKTIKVILIDDSENSDKKNLIDDEDYLIMAIKYLETEKFEITAEWGRNKLADSYIEECNKIIETELKVKRNNDQKQLDENLEEVKQLIASGKPKKSKNYQQIVKKSLEDFVEIVRKGVIIEDYLKSLINEDVDENWIYGCEPRLWQMILIRDFFWVNNQSVNVKFSSERLEKFGVVPVEPYRKLMFQSKLMKEKNIEIPFKTPYKTLISFLEHLSTKDFIFKIEGTNYMKGEIYGNEYKKL